MNRNEQIEKMAEDLGETWIVDLEGNPHNLSEVLWQCDIDIIAKQLYEASYRKMSEIAREIFSEIERNMIVIDDVDFNRFRAIGARTFAELKKKYTETNENDGV